MTRPILVAVVTLLAWSTWAVADGTTSAALSTNRAESEETTFGDLTADAIADAAATTVALAPAVLFKPGEIPAGPVSLEAVSGLLHDPGETWAVLELSGAQLREALERSVSFAPTPRVFFLQVSGIMMVYDPEAPRGRRIKSLSVGFEEVSDTRTYEVAMPESLADGGLGYFTVFGDAPRTRTGTAGLATLIHGYVQAQGTVSYTGQGRIVVGG